MATMSGMTPTEKIEPFLWQESLYEGMSFYDFIGIGTKWIEGCYCLPDRSLGQIMEMWGTNYEYVIVDSPAGVEHLNRRITKKVKDVFNILDPSKKSFDNAVRSYKIMKEVDELVIIIGSSQYSHNLDNPFTAGERIEMWLRILQPLGINPIFVTIPDAPSNDVWVEWVQNMCPKFDLAITGDPLSAKLIESAGYKVKSPEFYNKESFNGTKVRDRIISDQEWKELVPIEVLNYLDEINGIDRVRKIAVERR